MSNQGKWAIVTGGSRGLGYETAKGLIAAGIFVAVFPAFWKVAPNLPKRGLVPP